MAAPCFGQLCLVLDDTHNKYRKVPGPVDDIECGLPGEVHSAPCGNWGIETETSRRKDGFQFEGWCHRIYGFLSNDPTKCRTSRNDDWYEWNSCTEDSRFAAPDPGFYNDDNHAKQKSYTSRTNKHGHGQLSRTVSCPWDSNGDYIVDEGGCKDAVRYGFYLTGHKMEMWDLDHWRPLDDKVGTDYCPTLYASGSSTNSDIYGCDAGSVGSFRGKQYGTPYVSASAAVGVPGATFINENGVCCDPLEDECE